MLNHQGFSLIEVLVSLSLMTCTSLALLKQQWQVTQLFNQIEWRNSTLLQLDNAVERLRAGDNTIGQDGAQLGKDGVLRITRGASVVAQRLVI